MRDAVGRKTLTSKEAARLLGVSEASVKRWADGGLLPAERTVGGHRRFRPEAVAAFRRTSREGAGAARGHAAREEAGGVRREARIKAAAGKALTESLFESLVEGQAEEAAALFVNLHLRGHTVASIADAVLCPAMRRVGELWRAGEVTVAQEHVATRTALVALRALRDASGGRESNGLKALCCSVEEDYHELPVRVAALVLEAEGWNALTLGASTPFYALAEAVSRFGPRLVCVASTVFGKLDRAAREYAELRAAARGVGASVVLGGAGFAGAEMRRRFPAELHADSFTQLETFAPTLAGEGG